MEVERENECILGQNRIEVETGIGHVIGQRLQQDSVIRDGEIPLDLIDMDDYQTEN